MELVDTHCHIHSTIYPLDPNDAIKDAIANQVAKIVCVGEGSDDIKKALILAEKYSNISVSAGFHPHEARLYRKNSVELEDLNNLISSNKIVAIGECGLDYYYDHSDKSDQRSILEYQLDIASRSSLPVIFHVREAFDDFWPIYDNFRGIKGVIHSFTADETTLTQALNRGLLVGLNGIITFSKDPKQLEAAKKIPLTNLVVETDAPFLTPAPFRGTICQPKHVRTTAEFLAKLRGESLEVFAENTTKNAIKLFNL